MVEENDVVEKDITEKDIEQMSSEELDALSKDAPAQEPSTSEDVEKVKLEQEVTDEEAAKDKEAELDYKALYEKEKATNTKLNTSYMKQSTDVGNLRKELNTRIEAGSEENYTNTVREQGDYEANKTLLDAQKAELELQTLENQFVVDQTKITVLQKVPDFEAKIEPIIDVLKDLGYDDRAITEFKANPFIEDSVTLITLAKQADLKVQVLQLQNDNTKLKTKTGDVLDDIEKAAKSGPDLTALSGKIGDAGSLANISEDDIEKMSEKDLDAYLAAKQ